MDLSTVHIGVHKVKPKKRVGRGVGSGHGKTASRGAKGQWASAGAKKPTVLFEGGQMQLFRRIPKRGFSHATWDRIFHVVNVGDLDAVFQDGDTVDQETLKKVGLAKGPADGVRILGTGEADQAARGQGAPLLEVRRREDRRQGGNRRGHPAAQEADSEQDEAPTAQAEGVGTRIESRRRQGDKETRRQGESRGFLSELPSCRRLFTPCLLVSLSPCLLPRGAGHVC